MLTLRKAGPKDIQKLLSFIEKYYAYDGIKFNPEKSKSALDFLVASPEYGQAYFFTIDDKTAGYGILTIAFDHEYGGKMATLTDFYFDPDFRGKGHGPKALKFLEEECINWGMKALQLQVLKGNDHARALYQKIGFHPYDERTPMAKTLL